MSKFFVTFPHRLTGMRNLYALVPKEAQDMAQAKKYAYKAYGNNYAFIYPVEELAQQVKDYNLTQIPFGESK